MPLPPVVLDPPFNILRISHIELNVTDLAASKKFYCDTLGLAVTDETNNRLYLRAMEERSHHCVILVKADKPSVAAMAYRVWAEDDLDKAESWFKSKGHKVEWVERAYQGRTLRTHDNAGMPIELHHAMDRLPSIHQQYAQYKGVKPLRIDHFNCFSTNVDEATTFYHEMGFRTTEYTADEETGALWAAWLHRKGGVHDQAFTNGRGPRLHHVAFGCRTRLPFLICWTSWPPPAMSQTLSAAPVATAFQTHSFCISPIPTATALRSIAPTIKPSTQTTSRSTGTSKTHNAKLSGVHPRQKAGSKTAACLKGWK